MLVRATLIAGLSVQKCAIVTTTMAVLLQFPQMFLSCLLSSFLIILHLHFSDSADLTLSE